MRNNDAMRCWIDEAIKTYIYATVNKVQIEEEDVQILLDDCRKVMGMGAIYVLEGLATNSGFEVTMESRDEDIISLKGFVQASGTADYKKARAMYDEEFLRVYKTTRGNKQGTVLSYGLFHDNDFDGAVCMIDFENHPKQWSENEKRAIKKMGRALHRQIMIQRLKKIDKEREKQHQEMLRTLKEVEEANRAKSFFLFNMSHDIRTPMNAILGFTNMVKKNIDDKEVAMEYLSKLDASGKYMLRILNDVLDMAKIDSGKLELDMQVMDLTALCNKAEEIFRDSMQEKDLEFFVDFHIDETQIMSDAHRLEQVVINLLSNAMKYTKPGGKVWLKFEQLPCEQMNSARYEISVKDTGIGISKSFQKHLFEEFERERTATKSGVQGTGLGLAIAKKIADMLEGGSLVCNSELGVGTEFVFSFDAAYAMKAEESKSFELDVEVLKGKRVLLVEDNDLNREIAIDMLTDIGLICEEATDGAVAVDMISKSEPGYYDIVFMDIQMPYMDGYQATREIRMLENEDLAHVPIIAMTANAFEEDKRKALDAQMNAHLGKPIDLDEIIIAVKDVLKLR